MDDEFEAASVGNDQNTNNVPVEKTVHQASEEMQEIGEEGQQGVSNTAEGTAPSQQASSAPEPIPENAPETAPEAAPNAINTQQEQRQQQRRNTTSTTTTQTSPKTNKVVPPSKETEKCGAGSDMKEVDKKTEDITRNFRFNPEARWAQNSTAKLLRGFKRHTSRKSSEMVEETAAPLKKVGIALAEPNLAHKAKEASTSPDNKNGNVKHTINLKRDDSKENVWKLPRWEPNSKKNDAKSADKSCSSPTTPSTPVERFHGVRGFWEQKSLSLSGSPRQSEGKLTTGEAQATLMRLASAGRAVDFDEVRRLRKLLCEEWDRKS